MAPSPAAGKQQAASSGTPKTPTKLTRKPGSATPQKPGQSTTPANKGTPKSTGPKKLNTPSSQAPAKPDTQEAEQTAKDSAEDTSQKPEEAASQAQGETEQQGDDDDGPMSKVQGLDEAAPEPIDDDDDNDNAVEGAQQQAQDTAEGAGDDADDAAENTTEKAAGETEDDQTDDQEQQPEEQQEGGYLEGAQGLAGQASDLAEGDQSGAAQDTKDGAEEAADDEQEAPEEELDEAQKVAGEGTDEATEATEDGQDQAAETGDSVDEQAGEDADGAQDQAAATAEGAEDQAAETADGAEDQVAETAEGTEDQAVETAEGAEEPEAATADGVEDQADETAEGATDGAPQVPEGLDLSILTGKTVQEDGGVVDEEGNQIGKLVEGDAEDLEGYEIGDNGEILDEDGDLVGRCELLPEQIKKQLEEARDQGEELPEGGEEYLDQFDQEGEEEEEAEEEGEQLPGLEIMNGLTCQVDGLIYDSEGNTIGVVTDGDPQELQNAVLNDQGEFIDIDGNVVGHAKIHDEAAELVAQGIYEPAGTNADETAEEAGEDGEAQVDGVADEEGAVADETAEGAEDAVEGAEGVEGEAEGIEDQLPGIEALEGKELNAAGEVLDDGGNILANINDEELKRKIEDGEIDPNTLHIDDEGRVLDEDNNVLDTVDLAEGAAERLAGGPILDMRILEGKKVNKKGKIIDEDGEEIGELRDGNLADCAGKKANDKGEVLDKGGNVIGHVNPVRGEAAEAATKALLEELGEAQLKEAASKLPDLSILDGLKVNKKGKILNEDGDEIGQLVDGELDQCAGKKCNDKGDVLDKDGNVVGRVTTLGEDGEPEEAEAGAEEGEAVEGEGEGEEPEEDVDEGSQLPPLSILEGLSVNKSGKLVDSQGAIVGELIEGDAKKLSKSGVLCDAEGQFWDNKGHVIGRAQTLPQEEAEEEAPFAGLEELRVVEDGWVEDVNGYKVGVVTEGDAKKLIGRHVDEDGDIIDKKGSVVGHAERYEEPVAEEEIPEEVDLSFLQGKQLNKAGFVIGDDGIPIARLIEGKAKDLSGRALDDQGQFWNDTGAVIGRVEIIPEEERDQKPEGPFAGLEGVRVIEDGKVADENDNVVGEIVEGNPKRLLGMAVDEDGDILDKYGNVKGHAEPLPEEEEEVIDYSILNGLVLNKQGYVVNDDGVPFGRLVEGDAKELAGRRCDEQGLLYNDTGKAVGRCEVIPENERVVRGEGEFAGLEGLHCVKDGWVEDENENRVGQIVEGDAKRLVGMAVDEDGDILDKFGNVKGHAERWEEEEEVIDNSVLNGMVLNKQGYVVNDQGVPFGRLIEGDAAELAGRHCDEQGFLYNDTGKVAGKCQAIPENERVTRPEGPFSGLEGLRVVKDGWVEDENENRVGQLVEGNAKRLVGMAVDEDGDVLDKYGNVKGHAEPWEEEEQEAVDLSALAGCRINKHGNAVDFSGQIIGRVVDGDVANMVGKKVDGQGQIWDDAGNVIGQCELVFGEDTSAEGPFAGFEGLQIQKDGTIVTPGGDIIGRIIEGDIQKLLGHTVEEDGDILDKNGNSIGKAERWEPEEKERRVSPMSGKRVNKEGEVRDEQGDLMGKLTMGDLSHCVGQEIDDAGNVVDVEGNKIGEVTLIENIVEEEYEGPTEEELAEAAKREEEREIAEKMAAICTQTLERVQPVCKQITEYMDKADRTPKEELDEEQLVNDVKPLIEEAGRILQECNGSLRGLDPDGHIAAQAKGRSGTGEATPEEHRLAESLKELTSTVVTTIDNAKKKLNDMPHAKKKLNPLWGLMTQPLFQILAAVGLLLTGVLGLVGQLLNGLGLGGLVNGLMGGLGINKLLASFGLIDGDDKKKKKEGGGSKLSGLPIVGGLLGGSK
ncbi:hypothetical protein LTR37_006345 [Vermiconidia calcicola]|uniref:Uncharacterized protein n=1 Tax=Vermiconidia calcicola TaxID=1690605 RepID=A0ACC3NH86_9PEZI|nr:hypothetical protein LTR37_006345 [Vermiconidia calcicola]